jgi:lipopolysaccharide export system protein LptA
MKHFNALLLIACGFLPELAQALASDKNQPIHIQSDSAVRNEKSGLTTYNGHVQMDQGSLRINAIKIVIHSIDNEVTKIVATGTPAKYKQQPTITKPEVIATASTIEYLITDDKLHLIDNANLIQSDGSTMSGNRINYDMKDSVVKAASADNRPNQRIHMVIPPKSERSSNHTPDHTTAKE